MKFDNKTLRKTVNEWLKNEKLAENTYGHISGWDVSNLTDMSLLFYEAFSFNQPLNN